MAGVSESFITDFQAASFAPEVTGSSERAKPTSTGPTVRAVDLGKRLVQIVEDASCDEEALVRLLELAQQLTGATLALYFRASLTGELSDQSLCFPAEHKSQLRHQQFAALARAVRRAGQPQVVRRQDRPLEVLAAVPVSSSGDRVEVLVVVTNHHIENMQRLSAVLQILQLLAAYIGQWRGRLERDEIARLSMGLVRLFHLLGHADLVDSPDACDELLTTVRRLCGCDLVATGRVAKSGGVRVDSVSWSRQVAVNTELNRAIELVMTEGLTSSEPVCWRPGDSSARSTDAVRQLGDLVGASEIWVERLVDVNGRTQGVWLTARSRPAAAGEESLRVECRALLGSQLSLIRSARRDFWTRIGTWRRTTLANHRWRVASWLTVFVFVCVIPFPHRVKCVCDVQPVTQRFIAAPYEGRLEKVFVEPGDHVEAGEVVARMDSREIRLELAGFQADWQRAAKQRDQALANHDAATSQLALLEMERLKSHLLRLEERIANLELRSPADGVVISGDPKELEGARLAMGQTLIEVGPLDEMAVELSIPEADIGYVSAGMPVAFRLQAMPSHRMKANLERIHPRSEDRESENVFVGEFRVSNSSALLRPGMNGNASITVGRRPLVWLVFRRFCSQLLFRWGW